MFTLHKRWQRLVERLFDINVTKTGLSYFLTGDAKNVHCAICAFDEYAAFSQIQSQMKNDKHTYIHTYNEMAYNEMAQNEAATCASTVSRKKGMRRALSSLTNIVCIHHNNYRDVNKPLPCRIGLIPCHPVIQ